MSRARPPVMTGYEHLDDLGSGGYADVYLYEQAMPKRRVAVKVLRAESLNDDLAAQFTSEANLMAALSAHPYIVTIFGADVTDDGRPYLVMEYYPGANLSVRCRQKPLGVPEALRIGVQLAGAVETAHRAGILHRDLKPANVLTSAFGKPGLTDFGISAVTSESAGAGGLSIPWSPPEALDDVGTVDERSDVWSLAATVYTLLAGHSPFEIPGGDNSGLGVMSRIEHYPLPPIPRSDMPPSLDRVLASAMAKKQVARTASASDFARALQAVERELRLQPTDMDIPEDVLPPDQVVASFSPSEPDTDGTRFRGAVSVDPAPLVALSAPPLAPPPVPVSSSFAPRVSGLTVRRAAPSLPHVPAPEVDAAVPNAAPRPGRRAAAPVTADRRPGRVLVWAVLGVVLLVTGVGAVVVLGDRGSGTAATDMSSDSVVDYNGAGGEGAGAASVPVVARLATAGSGDARTITAVMKPLAASDGWYVCQVAEGSQVVGKPARGLADGRCQLPAAGIGEVCVRITHADPPKDSAVVTKCVAP